MDDPTPVDSQPASSDVFEEAGRGNEDPPAPVVVPDDPPPAPTVVPDDGGNGNG